MSRIGNSDHGSASPLVAALVLVAVTVGLALAWGAAAVGAAARAHTAADLAALAAARVDRDERALGAPRHRALEHACAEAGRVAAFNGGSVVACTRGAGASVRVVVEVPSRPHAARAASRAGPSR